MSRISAPAAPANGLGLCRLPARHQVVPELGTTEEIFVERRNCGAGGRTGGVHVGDMESTLRRYSAMRRAVQQAAKAQQWLLTPAPHAHEPPHPGNPPHAH